ncbi:MAG TPA: pyridoxal 5'-phosphate synthase glutaminase subunit PdxT [Dehalococcoidia bacterium]|jgi:5'-phosphate synthase pdxT subunit
MTPSRLPVIGVLALQGDFAEHIAMLESIGVDAREVRLPSELAAIDGLIIPGGESTTITRLLDIYALREPLRRLGAEGMPIWGTCAGAIVLARHATDLDRPNLALMDIEVRRNAFGRQVDSFEADLVVDGMPGMPFHAVFIRAPIIERVGAGASILAKLDDGTIVAARERNLLATSFHPELTGDDRFHRLFVAITASRQATAAPK